MFILSFSISFVCLALILLILFRTQHQLTHPPVKDLTLPLRKMPVFQALHIGKIISLYPVSSLFGTQQQLTHPPIKSSTLPLKKMPVFQGVAPRHTIFTSSCVIPLWVSATAHSLSGKELNPFSRKYSFFRALHLGIQFSLNPASSLLGTQQQLTNPPVNSSSFLLWNNYVSQGLLFC